MNSLWADKPSVLLQKALDASAEKHRVAAHNIANVNTPNYKRQEVVFAQELEKANTELPLAVTNPRHIAQNNEHGGAYRVIKDNRSTMRTDGNNVDVEQEMAIMAMNQLEFNALTQLLNNRLSLNRYVINEGRR